MEPISIGVIGCGYWGPNLIKNFSVLDEFNLVGVADINPDRLGIVKNLCPGAKATTNSYDLLDDPSLEAVAIATPIFSHLDLASRALKAGKHVLVEKPMAGSVSACDELIELSGACGKVLLVDHTFIYTGAVEHIKACIEEGKLGDIYYFDSVRVNLGLFQHDYNVIWDLAPHDLSIMLHLIDDCPVRVFAQGAAPSRTGVTNLESIAYMTIHFSSGMIGHLHVNWLAPVKIRMVLIGGSKRMVVWDDLEADAKVKLYDRGVDIFQEPESVYKTLVQYRTGDMHAPKLDRKEALRKECEHFARCIRLGESPITDGQMGRRVVSLLEAAQLSLDKGGEGVFVT